MAERWYAAIDLKSFYASVECVERGLDPLDANLLVADTTRTDGTICLAVSPSLKSFGVPARPRLFEAKEHIREANLERKACSPGKRFKGKSIFLSELKADPSLELDYITAVPRMALYLEYSKRVYETYLTFVSPEDVLIYSVDEVFIDVTGYLERGRVSPRTFTEKMIHAVLEETGITATAGIGSNMYLAKVAMDIVAKRAAPDAHGVRIAELTEHSYREKLWNHRPLTDFWRIGRGTARRLESRGLMTMGDVARCSEGRPYDFYNEDLLYRMFGVNAELLIDHAWGYEPVGIADCKAYVPESRSISAGQVLWRPYSASEGKVIVREMADGLSMKLVRHHVRASQVVLDVSYDGSSLSDPERRKAYRGKIVKDHYGRMKPESVHGSETFAVPTSSSELIIRAVSDVYDRIVDRMLLIRRFGVALTNLCAASDENGEKKVKYEQLSLFDDPDEADFSAEEEEAIRERELKMQQALLAIRERYGANAVIRGANLLKESTVMERNAQIGGHKA